MRFFPISSKFFVITIIGSIILVCGYVGWLYWKTTTVIIPLITEERNSAQLELIEYKEQLSEAAQIIEALERDNAYLNEELAAETHRNADFATQIQRLSGTVTNLNKLANTDRELLQKYSRVYFLSENYIPSRLSVIPNEYILEDRGEQFFHSDAIRWLERMIRDASRENIELKVLSAYRSFEEQTVLKGQFLQLYGNGANQFSADQGYSEHQLGTAVDIVDPVTAATSLDFAKTSAYQWLLQNAHRYGFTLSYPEGNRFYIFEPWHWRFVGRDLATDLYNENAYFYDWDQRKIDMYLIKIFD
jgi:zinc D-Ala-D-Ala carboxypeptidase